MVQVPFQDPVRVWRLEEEISSLRERTRIPTLDWDDNSWKGLTLLEGRMFSVTNMHGPDVAQKKGPLAQVQVEAHTLSVLAHPNIVPVVGTVNTSEVLEDGQPAAYLAMKKQAVSLESRLQTTRLSIRQMVVGCQQAAAALNHVHAANVVHHDFRPGNLLLEAGEQALLLSNFGCSAARTLGGQPHWLVECLCHWQGMWAFGFLLLELLHGQMPACHKEFQTHPDYQAALQLGPSMDPRDVPGLKRHLVYLVGLSHDFDYASKVKYQPLPVNNAQEQQAVDVMKGLAAQYLQVGQLTPTSLVHTV